VSVETKIERLFSKLFPSIYGIAVQRGYWVERRWKKKRGPDYLKDNHPDRRYFSEFAIRSGVHSILEIGGGSQFEARMLRDRNWLSDNSYTILDINKSWLKEGVSICPEANFKYGSINKIPFADQKFELVYCRHVLEHQPYYERPIQEMMRVTNDYVVFNIFRWSVGADNIRRGDYYSNSYSIEKLLRFCKNLSPNMLALVVTKEGRSKIGPNVHTYENPHVRRTGDHLLIIMRKENKIKRRMVTEVASLAGVNILFDVVD